MREYNLDLQLHGLYAGGVSKNMTVPVVAEQARLKGLDVVVTADILHAKWFEHVRKSVVEESNGVYRDAGGRCGFIVGGEIEDKGRVHHLFYLPSLESAQELRSRLLGKGSLDCAMCGRPRLSVSAEEFAAMVSDAGGVFGPAHSFTPYTGVYAFHDSLEEAYGSMHGELSFIELGLSADTDMADTIGRNHAYAFLTSSDAHSPWPNRIGREFMRVRMNEPCFKGLERAFRDREGGLITLNAGLDPREGKYHCTACNSCFSRYSLGQAERLGWKCVKCGGVVKRGVRDRIAMLADTPVGRHPAFRPPYTHLLPLAEIIQLAVGAKSPQTKAVQSRWIGLVERFGSEIAVLVDAEEGELLEADAEAGGGVVSFRKGLVLYIPGGGGEYGKPVVCGSEEELERKRKELGAELSGFSDAAAQRTLGSFS